MAWRQPIEFYYPRRGARLDESVLEEFLNLKRGDEEGAARFIERYGLFATEDLQGVRQVPRRMGRFFGAHFVPRTVRRFFGKAIKTGRGVPFAIPFVRFWQTHETVWDLVGLAQAIRRRDHDAAKAIVKRVCSPLEPETKGTGAWVKMARVAYRSLATQGLEEIKIRLNVTGSHVPVACCDDVRTSLIWMSVCGGQARVLRQCANRKCGKYFFSTRPWNKFCKRNCQVLVGVNRHRRAKARREKELG
jgi:hypothetical protein